MACGSTVTFTWPLEQPSAFARAAGRPRPAALLVAALAALGAAPALGANVLEGRAPVRGGSPALTDGRVALDGADWQSPGATPLRPGEAVLFDLGEPRLLTGAAVQADNNDEYLVELSDDAVHFHPFFRAGPVGRPGLQTRRADVPPQTARFLQLRAEGGDGRYSVSELEVYSGSSFGSALSRPPWWPRHPLDVGWAWGVLGAAALLLLVHAGTPRRLVGVLASGAALGLAWLLAETLAAPSDAARVDFLRAAAGALGALAVLRELSPWPRVPAHRGVVLGVLGVAAALGLACFLNLGRPQFFDVGRGRPTFLHHYDMRTYFPIARFFPELRFDGVYAASAMAVAEDRGGLEGLGAVPLRDLRTHQGTTALEARAHLEAVRARFSAPRWAAFTQDMRYFRAAMGERGFLGSMNDHGGNATPVWFLGAWLLFAASPASDGVLWLGVAVDAALVLLAFWALFRAFGARTALVAMTLFGAMDFYQFGSNWFGAALRHDWLALWALGAWALQRQRHALGGALLAYSALIRAFPALALLCLAVPVAWDLACALRRGGFEWRPWLRAQRPFLATAAGAAAAALVLGTASVALFGVDAWAEWLHKVALLDRDNHLNNLSVRTYVTGTRGQWMAVVALAAVVVAASLKGASPPVAATWAVALVPIVFNPANYYLHAVFLLPVVGGAVRGAEAPPGARVVWLALLAMCVASYFTSFTVDLAQHFAADTAVLLVTLGVLATVLVRRAFGAPARTVC
jgi:hypothetical protein